MMYADAGSAAVRVKTAVGFGGRPFGKLPLVMMGVLIVALIIFWPPALARAAGSPSFAPAVNYSTGQAPRWMTTGDFNNDSKTDLATADRTDNTVSILLGVGDGTFGAAVPYGVGTSPYSVATGDFNADGNTDLVTSNFGSSDVSILLGNGDGTFGTAAPFGAGTAPYSVATDDFNTDGKTDLVVTNVNSSIVSILLGNGNGTFGTAVPFSTGTSPSSVVTGDFNADGKTDLATANNGSGTVSILLGNGNGTFQTASPYGSGANPTSVTTSDFNGDGKTDLAVGKGGSEGGDDTTVSILLGNGNGTFGTATLFGVGTNNPYSVTTGDFNADGKSDLATANYGSNNTSILLGAGDGTFNAAVNYGAGATPISVTTGDFNRDGKSDLAVDNLLGNNVSVLINTFKYYLWTWYDNIGGDNWVLMANPTSATQNLTFNLAIGGSPMNLSAYNNGVVGPGRSITPKYGGVMGGPVKAGSINGDDAIVSQRTLWPKGGSSLEEVPGTEAGTLSSHFYWTWYDMQSPGFKNWVLVANPSDTGSVFAEIRVAGMPRWSGTIGAGQNVRPTFPGVMGGPVEAQAWTDSGRGIAANVMASQRVLTNGGTAFNELPGTPLEALSNDYVWTWYDMQSAGARNWVLISNPPFSSGPIFYEVWIGGRVRNGGPIAVGASDIPMFPGTMGGPVEVKTFFDSGHTMDAASISSQRSLFGPSFEEVPGFRSTAMASNYHWTWFDMVSAGARNWVLVYNPNSTPVTAEIKIGGVVKWFGSIGAGASVTPTFPGLMGGPVDVTASGPIMASQRVLWNGYFNEVLGTVLD